MVKQENEAYLQDSQEKLKKVDELIHSTREYLDGLLKMRNTLVSNIDTVERDG